MKLSNFIKKEKSKYFKRQSDIFIFLKNMKIINPEIKILMPSFICSDVIYSLQQIGIFPLFYQLDKYLNINFKELNNQIEENNIELIYIYNSFNFYLSIDDFLKSIRKKELSFIFDNSHLISVEGSYQTSKTFELQHNNFIETFSPRKYFRLSEGSSLRLNGNFCMIKSEYNFVNLLIDKIRRSILIRRFLSNNLLKFNSYFYKFNNLILKDNKTIKHKNNTTKGASISICLYLQRYEGIYHSKSSIFYKRYINLFEKDLYIKDLNLSQNQIFWLIPLKKNLRIKKLYDFLNESMINPFMKWPDKHDYLSNYDKVIRGGIVYFRIDCLSCNNFLFDYISSLYYDKH